MNLQFRLGQWSAWAPGLATSPDWQEWVQGTRQLEQSTSSPGLPHLDPMFKRRLGQLSKMILHVGHELLIAGTDCPVVFASRWGEINQQYKISKNLIENGEVSPAAFSLSVFNTPVALLSIAEHNHDRSSALYAGEAAFSTALVEALGLLQQTAAGPVVLLVGDELIPEAYEALVPGEPALALALTLYPGSSSNGELVDISIASSPPLAASVAAGRPDGTAADQTSALKLPEGLNFLRWWLGPRQDHLAWHQSGLDYTISTGAQS